MKARQPKKKAPAKKPTPRKTAKPRTASAPRQARPAKASKPELPRLLVQVIRALDGKKAENIQVLDVSELSSITDYLVVGTATSEPHLRALRVELEKVIDAEKAKILGMDTGMGSGWTVIDAFDVMIHLFTPENREKYRLELLWRDASPVPIGGLL
jgi:ribosome-associated protein